MNLNLKMTVERSKRRSQFLSLVFITKCFNKNLLKACFYMLSCFNTWSRLVVLELDLNQGRTDTKQLLRNQFVRIDNMLY